MIKNKIIDVTQLFVIDSCIIRKIIPSVELQSCDLLKLKAQFINKCK